MNTHFLYVFVHFAQKIRKHIALSIRMLASYSCIYPYHASDDYRRLCMSCSLKQISIEIRGSIVRLRRKMVLDPHILFVDSCSCSCRALDNNVRMAALGWEKITLIEYKILRFHSNQMTITTYMLLDHSYIGFGTTEPNQHPNPFLPEFAKQNFAQTHVKKKKLVCAFKVTSEKVCRHV